MKNSSTVSIFLNMIFVWIMIIATLVVAIIALIKAVKEEASSSDSSGCTVASTCVLEKYVLFIPQGGINDCFTNISRVISYCKLKKRSLLLDMTNSTYKINFSDYFNIKKIDCNIIYNSDEIKNVLLDLENRNLATVHPNNLDFNLIDLFDTNGIIFEYQSNNSCVFTYKNTLLDLPNYVDENIILHSRCGGGNGYNFFKYLSLHESMKNIIKEKISLLKHNYLCIQVRNTDRQCNYKELYKTNKNMIDNFDSVYICTDSKSVFDFFKLKCSNVFCFTTFPEGEYISLHRSNEISPDKKMMDLFTDIFIATNSKTILSNSKGGFINLLKKCHNNKNHVLKMLQ